MKLWPKNWVEFQHYKDRAPQWIKLHRKILDDFEFHRLPVASRALAPCLWLLASEYQDGIIDATTEKIAFRLRMTEQEFIDAASPLIIGGFFETEHCASELLAVREQIACLEKRREELEIEKKKNVGDRTPSDAAQSLSARKEKKEKGKRHHSSPEDMATAEWMFSRVLILLPTAKRPNMEVWANSIRLMREQDNRTHKGVCAVFDWANKDTFWSKNILSPDKLREKWDTLLLQSQRASTPSAAKGIQMNIESVNHGTGIDPEGRF